MTGYGASSTTLGTGRVVVEVRSVNARALDVRTRMPDALSDATLWAEQRVRARLRRGRVEVAIGLEGDAGSTFALDKRRAIDAMRSFGEVAQELGTTEPPPLSLLASVPNLFGAERCAPDARKAAETALDDALLALEIDRAREGRAIAEELEKRAATIEAAVDRTRARAAALPATMRARLADRVAKLENVTVDPARLEAEVALLADRCDVSEELSRLSTHVAHLRSIVTAHLGDREGSGEPEGRRLDFLLQEALREATTLSVKAQDADVSADVVEIKVELERMREQVQNVE